MAQLKCTKCGLIINEKAKYCPKCLNREMVPVAAPEPSPLPPPPPQPPTPPTPLPGGNITVNVNTEPKQSHSPKQREQPQVYPPTPPVYPIGTSGLAVTSLVCSLLGLILYFAFNIMSYIIPVPAILSALGILFGFISLFSRKSKEPGIAGIIIGIITLVIINVVLNACVGCMDNMFVF